MTPPKPAATAEITTDPAAFEAGFWLGNGPVKPCTIVNGPTWNPPTH